MINGGMAKAVVGIGGTILVAILSFMGYGIVNNEERNVKTHTAILETVNVKVDRLKDVVIDVRLEQMEQRGYLERIEAKL